MDSDIEIDIDIDSLSETSNQLVSLGGGGGGLCFDFLEFYNMANFFNEIDNFIKYVFSGCIV